MPSLDFCLRHRLYMKTHNDRDLALFGLAASKFCAVDYDSQPVGVLIVIIEMK